MMNALRKELSIEIISKMTISDIDENIIGIEQIISENYHDLLPEGSDASQYYQDDHGYQVITEVLRDLKVKKSTFISTSL
jgi:site-specific DNA-adenine methylase